MKKAKNIRELKALVYSILKSILRIFPEGLSQHFSHFKTLFSRLVEGLFGSPCI